MALAVFALTGCDPMQSMKKSANAQYSSSQSSDPAILSKPSGGTLSPLDGFRQSVYVITRAKCATCHDTVQTPFHASSDVSVAYTAAKSRTNFSNIPGSMIVLKTMDGHCGANCTTDGHAMIDAVTAWKTAEFPPAPSPSPSPSAMPAPMDTTPPSVPAGLAASAVSSTQINLTWSASTDNVAVTGYRIFRNGTSIATSTTPAYSDTGLTAATAYSYTIAAFDAAGNASASSPSVSTMTRMPSDTIAPSVPSGLSATPMSTSQINLMWSASSDNVGVAGYNVYRNGTKIGTSPTISYADIGLTASTTYTYAIAAFDAAGNVSAQTAGLISTTLAPAPPPAVVDTTAPSVPTSLAATVVSYSQVNLSWAASTDNVAVTGYNIYRNGARVSSTAGTAFSDTGLSATTTYTYTIAAYDGAGNISSASASKSVTTPVAPDLTAPSVPGGLAASVISYSQINLSWSASTDNVGVTGYRIYRNGAMIATSASTSYSDMGLTASTSYTYSIAAYDLAGNSSVQSTAITAMTMAMPDTAAPSVPSTLIASVVSGSQINLSWNASTDNVGVAGYNIYRNGTKIATSTSVAYSDTGLASSTAYSYAVSAYDAAGNTSPQSAAVSATTSSTAGVLLDGSESRIHLANRLFAASRLEDIFGTAASPTTSTLITPYRTLFGGPCDAYNGSFGPPPSGSNSWVIGECFEMRSTTVQERTADSQAPIVPGAMSGRMGLTIRTCNLLAQTDANVNYAATQALGGGTTPTGHLPTDSDLQALYGMFYPGQTATSGVLTGLRGIVTQAQSLGYPSIDAWRFVLYALCSDPYWQVP